MRIQSNDIVLLDVTDTKKIDIQISSNHPTIQIYNSNNYLNNIEYRKEFHLRLIEQILMSRKQRQQWEDELKKLIPDAGKSVEIDAKILELDSNIENSIDKMIDLLNPGGRLSIITFHSLEDRIVKNTFRNWSKVCSCPPEQPICTCGGSAKVELLTRKPIGPTEEEVKDNSPSRSAKLRVIRKLR